MKEPIDYYKQCQDLIVESLRTVQNLYTPHPSCKFLMRFPESRGGCKRVSEQEARFSFVYHLIENSQFKFSVENPTKHIYRFPDLEPPQVFSEDDENNGRSGSIDVCVYDDAFEKILFPIEFKANLPKGNYLTKDFLKLAAEAESHAFFVWLIESADTGTYNAINKRMDKIHDFFQEKLKTGEIAKVRGETSFPTLDIYLCILSDKKEGNVIRRYSLPWKGAYKDIADWERV